MVVCSICACTVRCRCKRWIKMIEVQACMDIIDRQKVNRIVEYIRSCGDFPYDTDDVIEDLSGILYIYGIYNFLSRDEELLLLDELLELAEQSEISEAVRWASSQLKCGMDSMPIVVEHSGFVNGLPFRFRSAESLVSDYRVPGYL